MSDTAFVDGTTLTDADWFNDVNRLHYTVLGDPSTAVAALNALQGKGSDVASAATVNLDTATGDFVHITGSTGPITAITLASGDCRTVVFDSTPTLTYNATTLILPGNADIVAAAGDIAMFRGDGSGNTRCIFYTRAAAATADPITGAYKTNPAGDAADSATYSFTATNIGTPALNRAVVVAVHWYGAVTLTDVSIAGFPATIAVQSTSGTGGAAIALAWVPNGTTADIGITLSGGSLAAYIGVYTIHGLNSLTPIDTGFSTADPATDTLTSNANGYLICAASRNAADSQTWTNVTETYDTSATENRTASGASIITSGTSISPSGNWATGAGNQTAVFATF